MNNQTIADNLNLEDIQLPAPIGFEANLWFYMLLSLLIGLLLIIVYQLYKQVQLNKQIKQFKHDTLLELNNQVELIDSTTDDQKIYLYYNTFRQIQLNWQPIMPSDDWASFVDLLDLDKESNSKLKQLPTDIYQPDPVIDLNHLQQALNTAINKHQTLPYKLVIQLLGRPS